MASRRTIIVTFITGLAIGISISYSFTNVAKCEKCYDATNSADRMRVEFIRKMSSAPVRGTRAHSDSVSGGSDNDTHHHQHLVILDPRNDKEMEEVMYHSPGIEKALKFHDEAHHHHGSAELANQLYKEVPVLCWVMTYPGNLDKKAQHVKATWATRCNVNLFMSEEENKDFPTVGLDVPVGYKTLWAKTRAAFQYLYDHHLSEAEWFMKADDDTYVIVENLRYFLVDKNPEELIYYGRRFKPFHPQGYMSGGAGYVISRAALIKVVEEGLTDPKKCASAEKNGAEDVQFGKCLAAVGVKAGDSRDEFQSQTFHPFMPQAELVPNSLPKWMLSYDYYPIIEGPGCCSDYSISFHYVNPQSMYLLEYVVYHLHPFGMDHSYNCPAPPVCPASPGLVTQNEKHQTNHSSVDDKPAAS